MKQRYIDMSFDEARQLKYAAGQKKHRCNGEAGFVGDPFEEAFMECLDLDTYLEVIERQTGQNMSIMRSQARQMASVLQARQAPLPR